MNKLPPLLRFSLFEQALTREIFGLSSDEEVSRFIESQLENISIFRALTATNKQLIERYQQMKTQGKITQKLQSSLLRYLVRLSYRPTPYGLFSSVASLQEAEATNCFHQTRVETKVFGKTARQSEGDRQIDLSSMTLKKDPCLLFIKNTAIFWDKNKINTPSTNDQLRFDLSPSIIAVLKFCQTPKKLREIIREFSVPKREVPELKELLLRCIEEGILLADQRKSPIGGEYLKDLGHPGKITLQEEVEQRFEARSFLEQKQIDRKTIELVASTTRGLHHLSLYWRGENSHWFRRLKEEFGHYYLGERVRLLDFLHHHSDQNNSKDPRVCRPEIRQKYLELFRSCRMKGEQYIDLSEGQIQDLKIDQEENARFPELKDYGMIVSLSREGEKNFRGQYIYASFGLNCQRAYSRFAGVLPGVTADHTSELGSAIVADVDYDTADRAFDHGLRSLTSKYVISLSHMTSTDDRILIGPEDLDVFLEGNFFRLFSRKLQKEVVITLTTPYIQTMHNHPLYKFLGYVAQDGHKVYLDLPIEPTMSEFQPGIRYNGFVLSPKKWFLKKTEFLRLMSNTDKKRSLHIPEWVAIREADKVLPISTSNEFMAKLILSKFSDDQVLHLEEEWHLNHGQPLVLGEKTFSTEIIVPVVDENKNLTPGPLPPSRLWMKSKKAPISICIDVPKSKAELLMLDILPALEKLKTNRALSGYYYIYYPEPCFQIRLRLFGVVPNVIQQIHSLVFKWNETYGLSRVGLFPFQDEALTYGGDLGQSLYHEVSCISSRHQLKRFHARDSFPVSFDPAHGHPFDVIYLVHWSHLLRNFFEVPGPQPTDLSAVKIFTSSFWKRYGPGIKNADDMTITARALAEKIFHDANKSLLKIKSGCQSGKIQTDKAYFRSRLIHMEVFRITGGLQGWLELSLGPLERKIYGP
jgi:hypothetical protein